MTDRSDLTPDQESDVRRMLADARHTDPVPPEVAARLDRVLADLAAEPAREATVVRLADRRRRVATLLVAAAAVVVAGVGIGQVVGDGGLESSDTATDAGEAPAAEEAAPRPANSASEGSGAGALQNWRTTAVTRIRPGQFAEDTARLQRRAAAAQTADDTDDDTRAELYGGFAERSARDLVCEPGAWGRGVYAPVRYGGAAGYVVFRRARGDTQVADLFVCGSELAVRSVTLPSR